MTLWQILSAKLYIKIYSFYILGLQPFQKEQEVIFSICNFRFANVKKSEKAYGIKFLHLIMAVIASSAFMTLTGCSSATGTDLAPREEILKNLRAEGFLFNKHVISTVYGENQNQVIVSGQLAQKTPDNRHVPNGFKVTQHRTLIVENVSGAWKVASAAPLQREQLSSRQRW